MRDSGVSGEQSVQPTSDRGGFLCGTCSSEFHLRGRDGMPSMSTFNSPMLVEVAIVSLNKSKNKQNDMTEMMKNMPWK
jgi:hypothetical protein